MLFGGTIVGGGTFDTSEYRTTTYGAPTHYCDPTLSVAAPSGAGTLGDPWNIPRAMATAVAGNVVGFLPGLGAIMTSTDDDNIATMRPANSGTSNSRIVFVTKYAAIALATVATNALRTQLRHDGIAEVAVTAPGPESGSAMYGTLNTNYATFDGFYVDMASAHPKTDSGVLRVENGTGVRFRNFVVAGVTENMNTNACIIRTQQATDTLWHNFRCTNFVNTGAGALQRGFSSVQYGDQNYTIEYFDLDGCDNGLFPKGTAGGGTIFNAGTIRYGRINACIEGMGGNDFHASTVSSWHHVLISNWTGMGVRFGQETTPTRNLSMRHVTIANGTTGGTMNGCLYIKDNIYAANSGIELYDNICDWATADGEGVNADEYADSPFAFGLHHNGYFNAGPSWRYNASPHTTLAAWQSATSQDASSQLFGSDPFTNRAGNDYRIAGSHAALTGSSVGGQMGCYEGSVTPGPYGSYGF